MKKYISRLRRDSKPIERVWWWLGRLIMLGGIIESAYTTFVLKEEGSGKITLQLCANTVGLFTWEIAQATSERCVLRYLPSYVQNFGIVAFLLSSFGGAYLDFYYSIPAYDLILHVIGGGAGVWVGYECVTAMQKRDKSVSNLPILLLAAFGFSFILGTGWELFEFTFDQVAGGDAQHWSYELAAKAAADHGIGMPNVLSALDPMRYAIIDTMEDIICNTVGAVAVYLFIKKCPYHHRGKNDVNKMFDSVQDKHTETQEKQKAAVN